jgi:hypothetical protein
MLGLEVGVLYGIVVASFAFSIMAVVFAYRLSRITGLFSAWVMLIIGLGLTAFEDFAYFGSVIFVGYSKVETLVQGYTLGTFIFAGLILLAIPALFFASMFKMHAIFRAQKMQAQSRPPL